VIDRPNTIVLQCQHEMGELGKSFKDTQVALRYENETREGFDATRNLENRLARELPRMEHQQIALVQEGYVIEAARQALLDRQAAVGTNQEQESDAEVRAKPDQTRTEGPEAHPNFETQAVVAATTHQDRKAALKEQVEKLQRTVAEKVQVEEEMAAEAAAARKQEEILRESVAKAMQATLMAKIEDLEREAAERAHQEQEAELKKKSEELEREEAERLRLDKEKAVQAEKVKEAAAERDRLKQEMERLERDAAKNAKAQKAMALKLKEYAEEEERAKKENARLKKEIDHIESQSGWTPRFIVNNKTNMRLHIRAYRALPPRSVVNYENDIGAGQLRAIHCPPDVAYGLEVHLGIANNRFAAKGQVLRAMASTGIVAASAAAAVGAVVASGGTALPLLIGGGFAGGSAGSLAAFAAERLRGRGHPNEDWTINGFESQLYESEASTVMFESEPLKDLSPVLAQQLFAMENTRQGKPDIPLLVCAPFSLLRTTRVEIIGGTRRTSKMTVTTLTTGHEREVVKYIFDKDATPVEIVRVDTFASDNKPQ
jgi:hypothetical protein